MSEGEEIIAKATPNFLYNFLMEWSTNEMYFSDGGINLICISQKKSESSNRSFYLKVLDGTIPTKYFGFLIIHRKVYSDDFNCVNKYIRVNGFRKEFRQGVPFICTEELTVLSDIVDFDLQVYIKNMNLQNVNRMVSFLQEKNNSRSSQDRQNEYENPASNRKMGDVVSNEQMEQNLRSGYEKFRAYNENLSAEQNRRNYNCSYNEYVQMYGPNSVDAVSGPPLSGGNIGRVSGGAFNQNPNFPEDPFASTRRDKNMEFRSPDGAYNKGGNSFFEDNFSAEESANRNVPRKTEVGMYQNVRKGFDTTNSNELKNIYNNGTMGDDGRNARATSRIPGHDINRMYMQDGTAPVGQGTFGSNSSNPKGSQYGGSLCKGDGNFFEEAEEVYADPRSSIPSKSMQMYDMGSSKYDPDAMNKYRNRDVNSARMITPMHENDGRTGNRVEGVGVRNENRFSGEKSFTSLGSSHAGSMRADEAASSYEISSGGGVDNLGRRGNNAYYEDMPRKGNNMYGERSITGGREDMSFTSNQEEATQNRNKPPPEFKEEEKLTKGRKNQSEGVIDETMVSGSNKVEKVLKDNTSSRNNRKVVPYQKNTVLKTNEGMMMPIKKLSQYCSKWIIKARVQKKDGIRKFTTQNKEGQLFIIELCDGSGEIRANFFGKAVDKWYNYIEEGRIYVISKGNVKPKNKKYNMLNHDCELSLDENSIIELSEETNMIPKCMYNFVRIDQIKNMHNDTFVDVIGIAYGFQELTRVFVKRAEEYRNKRDVVLLDESNEVISISLWGQHASKLDDKDLENKCVLAFKGLKIKEWQGKKLESSNLTKIEVNPDLERAHILRSWWQENKNSVNNLIAVKTNKFSIDTQTSIERMQEYITSVYAGESSDKVFVFTIFGIVEQFYNTGPVYPACPKCNKKMTPHNPDANGGGSTAYGGDGDANGSNASDNDQEKLSMFCSKCQKHDLPVYNYSLNLKISDSTHFIKASAFANSAKTIMNGISADEYMQIRDKYMLEQNLENFDLLEKSKLNEFYFRIKVHITSQVDEFKTNYTILEAIPLDKVLSDSCRYLIKSIKSFSKDEEIST